jgi:hypothetical protein
MSLTVFQQGTIEHLATMGAPSLFMTRIVNADKRTLDNYIQTSGLPTNSTVAARLPHETPSHIHRQVVYFVEQGARDLTLLNIILKRLDWAEHEHILFIRDWNLLLQSRPQHAPAAARAGG